MKDLQYKISQTGELKDVDVKSRTMTGYFSKFGNVDSDSDMMMPGAFSKSINERGPGAKNQIWFLDQHNWDKALSKPHVIKEDSYGLYYEATVNENLSYAKDVLILASEGHLKEHSFGFTYVGSKMKHIEDGDYYEIYEVKLFEGSIVRLGANPETPFLGFKACKTAENKTEYLLKEFTRIQDMIKVGNLTDDTYLILEMKLNQIKGMIQTYEPQISTFVQKPVAPVKNDETLRKEFYINLLKQQK
jgi:HK97 family phage prohead protease